MPGTEAESSVAGAPRVSILCVTYQHERFALDALRGLLQQTYPAFETIILDDASVDATADIIAGELARHPHRTDVRLVRNQRNLGYRGNVLKGVAIAQG